MMKKMALFLMTSSLVLVFALPVQATATQYLVQLQEHIGGA